MVQKRYTVHFKDVQRSLSPLQGLNLVQLKKKKFWSPSRLLIRHMCEVYHILLYQHNYGEQLTFSSEG